ncbi:MAG TPA: response regulator [Polyangiaceae bacterium]|nr:response regulator [Polyangiaceae bacterium]
MKTVLVVDDEVGLADALGDVLRDEKFDVRIARNGMDGLKRVHEQRPDLILLDYMMPIMDGCEMLKALRADASYRDIPVLLMSAVATSNIPADCTVTAFLRKPFDIDTLMAELERLGMTRSPK